MIIHTLTLVGFLFPRKLGLSGKASSVLRPEGIKKALACGEHFPGLLFSELQARNFVSGRIESENLIKPLREIPCLSCLQVTESKSRSHCLGNGRRVWRSGFLSTTNQYTKRALKCQGLDNSFVANKINCAT